jgi:hypothetical protein
MAFSLTFNGNFSLVVRENMNEDIVGSGMKVLGWLGVKERGV